MLKRLTVKKFARTVIVLFAAMLIVVSSLSVSGLISMSVKERATSDALRYSLGFTHPNQVGIIVFEIIAMLFYIDAGTTTGEMLQYLRTVRATYITNCVSHAQVLANFGHQVYVTGGVLKTRTDALVGSDTYKYIENMNFTIGFFGSNGVSIDEGFTTPDPQEGEIKRIAYRHCNEKYILADASKFNVISTYSFARIDQGFIITDSSAPKKYKDLHNSIIADLVEIQ